MQKITPHLWFDSQAEEAATFYTSVFKNSKILHIARYAKAAEGVSGKKAGSVMTVAFEIQGQQFVALNGGPIFTFSEAVSFLVNCDSQEEVDYYWEKLSEGGDPKAQQCGWLKDKYGVSWQVVPSALGKLMQSGDPAKTERVMAKMLTMKKIVIRDLESA